MSIQSYFPARSRRRWRAYAANAAAAAAAAATPVSGFPPADLVAQRIAAVPQYSPFTGLDSRTEAVVLDVPFGKRNSVEIRKWVKHIGGRWDAANKRWLLARVKCTTDAIKIVNELRLYTGKTVAAPSAAFLPRIKPNGKYSIILQVPYEDRADAKAAGARWDSAQRYWHIEMPVTPDLSFSKRIAALEAKGWVDVPRSQTLMFAAIQSSVSGAKSTVKTVQDLDQFKPADAAVAARAIFVSPPAAKPTVSPEEQGFIAGVASGEPGQVYSFGQPNGNPNTMDWQICVFEGCEYARVSTLTIGSQGFQIWQHSYMSKTDARKVWEIIIGRGLVLRSTDTWNADAVVR